MRADATFERANGTAVKICGLMRVDDARAAVDAGARALGVILAPGRRRSVSLGEASAILAVSGVDVARVGVFVSPTASEVGVAVAACGLTHVQIHDMGRDVLTLAVPVIEAIAVDGPDAVEGARLSPADIVLLDASVPGRHGGTGVQFDWSLLEASPLTRPFGLAGGLTSANVAEGVRRLGPLFVDVSSGVEREPGRKDHGAMADFIRAVDAARGDSR